MQAMLATRTLCGAVCIASGPARKSHASCSDEESRTKLVYNSAPCKNVMCWKGNVAPVPSIGSLLQGQPLVCDENDL